MDHTHARRLVTPHLVAFGPTFSALQPAPEAGPSAALWSVLVTLGLLCSLIAEADRPASARVEAARLANRLLQMGWRTWQAWESEAAYQHGAEPYSLEMLTVEQAGADLRRAEAVLRRLEADLVGVNSNLPSTSPPLARAGGSLSVRSVGAPVLEAVAG